MRIPAFAETATAGRELFPLPNQFSSTDRAVDEDSRLRWDSYGGQGTLSPFLINSHLLIEPLMRIELTTSSLPRKCSTTELQRQTIGWSADLLIWWLMVQSTNHYVSQWTNGFERETRFELATYSLEGYRSTNWATPAVYLLIWWFGDFANRPKTQSSNQQMPLWGEQDSNLWRHKSTDLQSVLVGRLSIPPISSHDRPNSYRIRSFSGETFSQQAQCETVLLF